ncbi:hypothetical protein [Candidatus Frankia alpina]|nr:hypothetical protein [Candidatus Frankia alpina]
MAVAGAGLLLAGSGRRRSRRSGPSGPPSRLSGAGGSRGVTRATVAQAR